MLLSPLPFWSLHAALISSYFIIRGFYPSSYLHRASMYIPYGTAEVDFAAFCVLLIIATFSRRTNLHSYSLMCIVYLEGTVGVLLYMTDVVACARYVVIVALSWLVFRHDALQSAEVIEGLCRGDLGALFRSKVLESGTSPAVVSFVTPAELALILLPASQRLLASNTKAEGTGGGGGGESNSSSKGNSASSFSTAPAATALPKKASDVAQTQPPPSPLLDSIKSSMKDVRFLVLFCNGRDDAGYITFNSVAKEYFDREEEEGQRFKSDSSSSSSTGSSTSNTKSRRTTTRFLAVDTLEYPSIGLLIPEIDLSVPSTQLPCLVLFQDGKMVKTETGLVRRLPIVDSDGAVTHCVLSARNINEYFKL